MSLVGGVRGATADGLKWDVSGTIRAHEADLFISDTVNAPLGPESPTAFDLGSNRQQEVGVNFDVSYAATDRVNGATSSRDGRRSPAGSRRAPCGGPRVGRPSRQHCD